MASTVHPYTGEAPAMLRPVQRHPERGNTPQWPQWAAKKQGPTFTFNKSDNEFSREKCDNEGCCGVKLNTFMCLSLSSERQNLENVPFPVFLLYSGEEDEAEASIEE